jgi:hypothetical protein
MTAGVLLPALGCGETHSPQAYRIKDVLQGSFRPIYLPMVYSLFYIFSKYMYMLCTHNLEMNKMLYSWFVNLFVLFFGGTVLVFKLRASRLLGRRSASPIFLYVRYF